MASYADADDDQYPDGYEFGSAPKYWSLLIILLICP